MRDIIRFIYIECMKATGESMGKRKGLVTIFAFLGLLSLGSSTETTLLVFSRFATQSLLLRTGVLL